MMIQHLSCGVFVGCHSPAISLSFRNRLHAFLCSFSFATRFFGKLGLRVGRRGRTRVLADDRLLRFGNLYEVIQAALRAQDCGFRFPGPIHKTAGQFDRTRPLCPYLQSRSLQRHRQYRRRIEFHLQFAPITGRLGARRPAQFRPGRQPGNSFLSSCRQTFPYRVT